MSKLTLNSEAFVLRKRPPAESFQALTIFSAEHGTLSVMQRISKKTATSSGLLDLFDQAAVILQASSQGSTWFLKESQLLKRHTEIGRSYEALRLASEFADIVARNDVNEESRANVYSLLKHAFAGFSGKAPPEVVAFKSLYSFAKDEGYPLRQEWIPTLPSELHRHADALLKTPLVEFSSDAAKTFSCALLQRRLQEYLRGHTALLME